MDIPIYIKIYGEIVRRAIELKAYYLYEWRKENNEVGSNFGDWLQAECEILELISEMP
jgi:hypothetical protein